MRRALMMLMLVLALPGAALPAAALPTGFQARGAQVAGTQAPPPVPSSAAPQGVEGVGVEPAPGSRYASRSGSFVELGTVPLDAPVTGEVVLRNQGTAAVDVLLYASDGQPAQGGGFGFSERAAADREVGSWLTLPREQVTVPGSGEVRATYRVVVPRGVAGGEYVGAVVVEPAAGASGAGVQTATRTAMAVYLTVPGGAAGATPGRGEPGGQVTLEGVELARDAPTGRQCPVLTYRNGSQKIVDPRTEVTVDGLLADAGYVQERTGAVLPGSSAEVRLPCVDRPVGPSTLRVRLLGPAVEGDYSEGGLYLPVPVLLALLLLLLLVLALVTTALRGARRRPVAEGPDSS